jgi:hypothetical protein
MTARVLVADEAIDRLAELGLSLGLIERVVRHSAGDRGIVVEVSRL